jgi:hypothetical protein
MADYEFIMITTNSFIFHTKKDKISLLDEEKYEKICEFVQKYIRMIDLES